MSVRFNYVYFLTLDKTVRKYIFKAIAKFLFIDVTHFTLGSANTN